MKGNIKQEQIIAEVHQTSKANAASREGCSKLDDLFMIEVASKYIQKNVYQMVV
jgi:hypothetical protein